MKSDILNIGRLQLYSVWEQFHAKISWTVLLKIIITNRIFTRMTSNVCKESITFITHLGMTFSAVLLKSVKSCPEMYTRKTALT